MKFALAAITFLLATLNAAANTGAQSDLVKWQRAGLKGLNGFAVYVNISARDPNVTRAIQPVLLNDAQLLLRKNRIIALAPAEATDSNVVHANFVVKVRTYSLDARLHIYSISVSVKENATLVREKNNLVFCTTWQNETVGSASAATLENQLRRSLREIFEVFLNDYLAAQADVKTQGSFGLR